MIRSALFVLLLGTLIVQNECLSCLPCVNKTEICTADLTLCHFGLASDMCGCCDICAKGEGEQCGGIWNHGGTCSKGLFCHPNPDPKRNQDPGTCSPKPLPPGYKYTPF